MSLKMGQVKRCLYPSSCQGGTYHPIQIFFPTTLKPKKVTSRLGNLNYILCGHFVEKIPPSGGKSQPSKMAGCWLPLRQFEVAIFEKYLHAMQLKLTEYDRITIFLLYKPKHPIKLRYLELSSEIF